MIKITDLLKEEETFTATSKKSGETAVFKTKDARDAAVKAGTHSKEGEKGGKDEPKGDKPNMFSKDSGYDAPDTKKSKPKSTSSEPDYDKYTSKAQTVTDFMKGDLSTDDIQKIADKNFGKEVATEKELDGFLNNKFIQGIMADEYGVDKEQMVSKVKELKAALFGDKMENSKNESSIKLKDLLSEKLINEGTRSQIGVIDRSGNIVSTYVHYDGYPDGVGKIAKNHYGGGKIKQLLKVDKGGGISSLNKKMDGGGDHTFQNPGKDQTIFYGRDRGEKGGKFTKGKFDKVSDYIKNAGNQSGAEYVYLYNEKDKKWYFADTYKDKELKLL